MKKRRLKKLLCTSVIATMCIVTPVLADTVGIDALDTSTVVENTSTENEDAAAIISTSSQNDGNGPTVINQDDDDYYPDAEVEVVTEETDEEISSVIEEEEPVVVEEVVEEPIYVDTNTEQTGIPSLDQYVNVAESENTRWRIYDKDEASLTKNFEAYISSGTIRLEVFYTASAEMPEIIFTSSGGNTYSMTEGSKNLGKTIFKVKNGYSVSDYPDIKYSIIYISDAEDPGTWNIEIRLNEAISEFALITTDIPQNWQELDTDYKTQPRELLLWHWSEHGVDKTQASTHTLEDIIQMMEKDTEIPGTNEINTTEEKKEVKKSNPLSGFFTLLIFIIIAGVLAVVLVLRKLYAQNAGMISNRIIVANNKLSLRKKKADDQVEAIMLAEGELNSYFNTSSAESSPSSEAIDNTNNETAKVTEVSDKEKLNSTETTSSNDETVNDITSNVEPVSDVQAATATEVIDEDNEIADDEDFF